MSGKKNRKKRDNKTTFQQCRHRLSVVAKQHNNIHYYGQNLIIVYFKIEKTKKERTTTKLYNTFL